MIIHDLLSLYGEISLLEATQQAQHWITESVCDRPQRASVLLQSHHLRAGQVTGKT